MSVKLYDYLKLSLKELNTLKESGYPEEIAEEILTRQESKIVELYGPMTPEGRQEWVERIAASVRHQISEQIVNVHSAVQGDMFIHGIPV